MKPNYFTIHKNKKPRKIKYSKPFTKKQYEEIERVIDFFKEKYNQIVKLK